MNISFLGTGGGRFVVLNQLLTTGGFIIKSGNIKLLVDPGPGALIRAQQFKKNIKEINSIFVSHRHLDHYNDLEVCIEVMTSGATKKKGYLIGNKNVINSVSEYHLNLLEKYYSLKPDDEINFFDAKLTATKCVHKEKECIGFVLKDKKIIGYTADGEYYEGQEKYFLNCDCLIINCLRPRYAKMRGHMTSDKAKELIEKSKPKLAILQHFGMKMLFGVAEKEARWIEKETGIRTIAAKDGVSYNIDNKSLNEFL